MVNKCPTCIKERVNAAEPLIPSDLPDRLWQKVAADLFELKGQPYLLVTNYFSPYVEVAKLSHTTLPDVVVHLKFMFARHTILDQLLSNNGPQFSATSFAKFTEEYGFTHITTSPRYPQANGQVERAVQTAKNLLKKAAYPYKALMAYRATPLESGISPAELLMGWENPHKSPYPANPFVPKLALLGAVSRKGCLPRRDSGRKSWYPAVLHSGDP